MERFEVIRTDGALLCFCERADSPSARTRGLLGRRGLAPEEGLWIIPCRSIHTFFMQFTIDILFLNARHEVIGQRPGLVPWRMALAPWGTASVLELDSGRIESSGVRWGDRLEFKPAGRVDREPSSR